MYPAFFCASAIICYIYPESGKKHTNGSFQAKLLRDKMRKFILIVVSVVVVLCAVLYLASGFFFNYAADRLLPQLVPELSNYGIEVKSYQYKTIRITSLKTVTAFDIKTNFDLKTPDGKVYNASFYANEFKGRLVQLKKPAVILAYDNFALHLEKEEDIPGTAFGRFNHGYIQLRDPVYLSELRSGMKAVFGQINELFKENEIHPNVIIRALVTFRVEGKEAQAYLYTKHAGEEVSLLFEKKDIREMADTFNLELSDEEVDIIARYPLRAPLIMRITADARSTARTAARRDPAVPEDAYRHVLWSYLLTRKFGDEFAKIVTDAHEVLPTNTEAERAMDFHNNSIGRSYAGQGVPRERLSWLVQNDGQVVKSPVEMDTF